MHSGLSPLILSLSSSSLPSDFYGFDLYMFALSLHLHSSFLFILRGAIISGTDIIPGNASVDSDAQILLELNMSTARRTLHLYINNVLQPKFLSGFGDSLRFVMAVYFPDGMVQFRKLRKIATHHT